MTREFPGIEIKGLVTIKDLVPYEVTDGERVYQVSLAQSTAITNQLPDGFRVNVHCYAVGNALVVGVPHEQFVHYVEARDAAGNGLHNTGTIAFTLEDQVEDPGVNGEGVDTRLVIPCNVTLHDSNTWYPNPTSGELPETSYTMVFHPDLIREGGWNILPSGWSINLKEHVPIGVENQQVYFALKNLQSRTQGGLNGHIIIQPYNPQSR